MTGNPNFPTSGPILPGVAAAVEAFRDALNAAASFDRVLIGIKNTKRNELIDALHELADYVLFAAKGDIDAARSSLFTISKTHEPTPPLTKPQFITLGDGVNAGELHISVKRVVNARNYMFQWAADPISTGSKWNDIISTKSKVTLTGLPSGAKVWGRVIALGKDQQQAYSDVVCRIVQ